MRTLVFVFLTVSISLPTFAQLEDAESISMAFAEKWHERLAPFAAGEGLIACKTMMEMRAVTFREPIGYEGLRILAEVDPLIMQQRVEAAAGIDPDTKRLVAIGMAAGIGVGAGALQRELHTTSWGADVSSDVGLSALLAGEFLDAAAPGAAERSKLKRDSIEERRDRLEDLAEFFTTAKLIGVERINGRSAYHLRSTEPTEVDFAKGGAFAPTSAELWIDTQELVQVKMLIRGKTETTDGKKEDVFIERESSDFFAYRTLFLPATEILRMGKTLTAKEKRDLVKAKEQLAEMKAQLDSIPAGQRDMIMGMIGPKITQLETLTDSGAIEVLTTLDKDNVTIGGAPEYAQMTTNCISLPNTSAPPTP